MVGGSGDLPEEVVVVSNKSKMHRAPPWTERRAVCDLDISDARRKSPEVLLPIYDWCGACFPERAEET